MQHSQCNLANKRCQNDFPVSKKYSSFVRGIYCPQTMCQNCTVQKEQHFADSNWPIFPIPKVFRAFVTLTSHKDNRQNHQQYTRFLLINYCNSDSN